MSLALFLVADAPDLRQARVVSLTDLSFNPLPHLPGGDSIPVSITLLTAAGAVHGSSGDASLIPRLAIGIKGHDALVVVSDFTPVASDPKGWTCTLDLNDDDLTLFLRSTVGQILTLSFSVATAAGARTTWASLDCPVDDFIAAEDSAETLVEVDIKPWPTITRLVGGLSTDLDGAAHATLPPGYTVILSYGDVPQMFIKKAGVAVTDTDATPVTVRCKNYDPLAPFYWLQLS